jgi:protein-S-isoprenylcysteine O-methyltransferase Ste14
MRSLRHDWLRRTPAAGAALWALGFVAISARRYLGRNWGMPMSRKEQPELITSGSYAVIRHPIYTGLILAMLKFHDWRKDFMGADAGAG